MHHHSLQPQYINLIRSGQKTVEGRINSGAFAKIMAGDRIKFSDPNDPSNSVLVEVLATTPYPSFEEMLTSEGLENMLPGTTTISDGVKIYNQIPGYQQRCQQHGALALQIKLLDQSLTKSVK